MRAFPEHKQSTNHSLTIKALFKAILRDTIEISMGAKVTFLLTWVGIIYAGFVIDHPALVGCAVTSFGLAVAVYRAWHKVYSENIFLKETNPIVDDLRRLQTTARTLADSIEKLFKTEDDATEMYGDAINAYWRELWITVVAYKGKEVMDLFPNLSNIVSALRTHDLILEKLIRASR